jgi:hypothetical protein
MLRAVGILALAFGVVTVLASCSEAGSASPTADNAILTTLPPATASTTSASEPTTTTTSLSVVVGSLPEYAVVARVETTPGDTLVVLLDPASYTTLTDIDLENVIADVYERFPPVFELHVVDSEAAAELVLQADIDPDLLPILDEHYLVRLEDGFRIIYLGPFSAIAESILGS